MLAASHNSDSNDKLVANSVENETSASDIADAKQNNTQQVASNQSSKLGSIKQSSTNSRSINSNNDAPVQLASTENKNSGNFSKKQNDITNAIAQSKNSKQNRIQQNNKKIKTIASDADIVMTIAQKNANSQNGNAIKTNSTVNTTVENALALIDKSKHKPTHIKDSAYVAVVLDVPNKAKFVAEQNGEWKREIVANVTEIERTITQKKLNDGTTINQIDTVKNINYKQTKLKTLTEADSINLLALTSNVALASTTTDASNVSVKDAAEKVTVVNNVNLVPLASYKVGSSDKKAGFAARLYDMMSDYFNSGNPFYFSGSLGVQSMFSSPTQTGFHLGIGGFYEFKQRLTLGIEFKYMLNSYAAQSVIENYSAYSGQTVDNSGINPVFSALEQKYQNIYNLKSSGYLELPITLRYQLSRFSLMGGVYGSYMTGTKYNSQQSKTIGEAQTVQSNTMFTSTQGSINANDFKARYGVGYTLGVGYDFNKHLSADLRLTQNLWQSGNQNSNFSKNLYSTPGIQFSLFYFIGKKDKVIYMMKNN